MGYTPSFTLMEILRATLREVEQSGELPKNDLALRELKDSLVRAIAELSITRGRDVLQPGDGHRTSGRLPD